MLAAVVVAACGSDAPDPIKPCDIATQCDDANACTTDTCGADGRCHYARESADDQDGCTLDLCDPATGMAHHIVAPTDDHDACTTDSCDAATGAISHGAVTCGVGQHCDAILGCTGGTTATECYPGEPIDAFDEANGATVSTATALAVTTGSFCFDADDSGLSVPGDTTGGEAVLAWTPTLELSNAVFQWQSTGGESHAHLHMRVGACNDVSKELSNCADIPTHDVSTGALVEGVPLYLFVDEPAGGFGTYHLTVSGTVRDDKPCDLARPQFACSSTHACREGTPGDGDFRCRLQRCRDGIDNDGDGKTDWPFEPGCTSPSDDDELDPTAEPACGNGTDDDGDSRADYPDDPGCISAADTAEANECAADAPFTIISSVITTVPPTSATGFDVNTCGDPQGPHDLYAIEVPTGVGLFEITALDTSSGDVAISSGDSRCDFPADTGRCQTDGLVLSDPTPGWHTISVGTLFGGATLPSYLGVFAQGYLVDSSTCDPSSNLWVCTSPSICDTNHVCRKRACADGIDNDGDGKIDLADPGCTYDDPISDDDETDPATPPACANGIDDDGNGFTDYPQDPGCDAAGDTGELTLACYVNDATWIAHSGGQFQGDLSSASSGLQACGAAGPELVYRFRMPGRGSITVDACGTASFPLTIYEMDCDAGNLYCGDDCNGATVTFPLDREIEAEIFVDSLDGSTGAFTATLTGVIDPGEPCDPAQVVPGFLQCSSGQTCQVDAQGHRCQ